MTIGIIGRKVGMTRLFNEAGDTQPVTVIQVEPNRITQIKTEEIDGYRAIQVTTGVRRDSRVPKPLKGHFAKAGTESGRGLWEFRLNANEGQDLSVGKELKADVFSVGQKVDVTGTSIGKGFAGVIKRYHFAAQDATHGNSLSHRAPGSIGQRQTPGRVFKGKKMAGHLGATQRTVQNLVVLRVDTERGLLLIRGAVPGKVGDVIVMPAVKSA